ncbi:hypothetical protein EW145_g2890 [Phellinidium pouzarii]|uniref:Uncharacterized protein n=1 Tax=Phellinidium pouzarii TaxID=167371 RepID=A0A4S4L9L4_9AGAM|nr:hypothetical protein EW145_g2890 [Phellinidium pouzarii]
MSTRIIAMQVDIDPSRVSLSVSRWPMLAEAADAAGIRAHMHPTATAYRSSIAQNTNSSTARRKPKMTFRSPGADTPLALKFSSQLSSTHSSHQKSLSTDSSTSPSFALRNTTRSTCSFFTPAPPLFKMPLAYPSYHPFSPGQLLLAAAARADATSLRHAATNGSSSREDVNVHGDDGTANGAGPREDAEGRRSSSRTRRPVAKLREVADGDDDATRDSASATKDKDSVKSPKRKRAGGGGNGGGSRKKRKDVGGSAAPAEQQPRRERQRREAASAAAAATAMAENAEAVAAVLDAVETDGMEMSVAEPAATPASVDNSAVSGTPEEDEKVNETATVNSATEAKPARPKRQPRPKRTRKTPSASINQAETRSKGSQEPGSTRSTRSTRRSGSSPSGSEGPWTRASVPIADTSTAKTKTQTTTANRLDVIKNDDDNDLTANIDPALLSEEHKAVPALS